MRIIKKYPNRRLYDTAIGTYITLDEVKKLVIAGEKLQVIDARTKQDLTQLTLLQIILEQETIDTPIFTISVLEELIRLSNKQSQKILTQYLEHSMRMFAEQRENLQQQWHLYQQYLNDPSFIKKTLDLQKDWWEEWLNQSNKPDKK